MGEGPPGVASGRVESTGPYEPERRVQSRPPPRSPSEVASQMAALQKRLKENASLRQIASTREKLPIAGFKGLITDAVERNQVVLIAGETGCGKTTQVPQFLLDACWEKGRPCKILCTQPRRISAITVAERVATERGEPLGGTVGYQIRLDTVGGPGSSLMFCTNGILLRKLTGAARKKAVEELEEGDDEIDIDATHIVVDEIHERDKFADFVLIILRDILPKRPDLRLVLMSATLNADLFAGYFGGCPVINVPGFTHPVSSASLYFPCPLNTKSNESTENGVLPFFFCGLPLGVPGDHSSCVCIPGKAQYFFFLQGEWCI
jgi:ATP-dependent RNA helicase DHX36